MTYSPVLSGCVEKSGGSGVFSLLLSSSSNPSWSSPSLQNVEGVEGPSLAASPDDGALVAPSKSCGAKCNGVVTTAETAGRRTASTSCLPCIGKRDRDWTSSGQDATFPPWFVSVRATMVATVVVFFNASENVSPGLIRRSDTKPVTNRSVFAGSARVGEAWEGKRRRAVVRGGVVWVTASAPCKTVEGGGGGGRRDWALGSSEDGRRRGWGGAGALLPSLGVAQGTRRHHPRVLPRTLTSRGRLCWLGVTRTPWRVLTSLFPLALAFLLTFLVSVRGTCIVVLVTIVL
ncbi:hypothetical protein E2C01_042671 [Portunus trituberculatus]|uniref:Uncharacterized protein n=1 Tax=Portunus trituberculatus TaxID=210409 RepID=A0A5B7FU68_PORTR|nr:hypothetical protein [Portunus trituberculatus]